mgnify:CR=1 FL=1
MDRTINYQITEDADGLRIEQFLRHQGYSYQNITQLKKMPESILKNGVWEYMRSPLAAGDTLTVHIQEIESSPNIPPVELPLHIIYEDDDILVVNKPAGMPIHPSLNNYENSLANGLMWYYTQQGKPFIFRCTNRLDRDTSGLTVIAKHLISSSILSSILPTFSNDVTSRSLSFCSASLMADHPLPSARLVSLSKHIAFAVLCQSLACKLVEIYKQVIISSTFLRSSPPFFAASPSLTFLHPQ